jgi:hypothetical protein
MRRLQKNLLQINARTALIKASKVYQDLQQPSKVLTKIRLHIRGKAIRFPIPTDILHGLRHPLNNPLATFGDHHPPTTKHSGTVRSTQSWDVYLTCIHLVLVQLGHQIQTVATISSHKAVAVNMAVPGQHLLVPPIDIMMDLWKKIVIELRRRRGPMRLQ